MLAKKKIFVTLYHEPKRNEIFMQLLGMHIVKKTQSDNKYKNIAVLYYNFVNSEIFYLNFKVKLTIGIRSNNKHVQYCVNKIEVK